ncbi:hypothetical protein AAG747_14250 [Rapidithrix thailandica]|uniref:Uncharacterized protein n=1 Tax=Rapidithrix thailandica TaxID=413964 RepID=A0AAW9SBD3_9BACT
MNSLYSIAQPSKEAIKKQVADMLASKEYDTELLPTPEALEVIQDEINIYEGHFSNKRKTEYLAVCAPGGDFPFGFYDGMPIYLLLKYNANGKLVWYKQWYAIAEVKDINNDGKSEVICKANRCKDGKCTFEYSIMSFSGKKANMIYENHSFDNSGVMDDMQLKKGDTVSKVHEVSFSDEDNDGVSELVETVLISYYDGPGKTEDKEERIVWKYRNGKFEK